MLYHHAITAEVARSRTEALIAEAAAEGLAARAGKTRASRLLRWPRRMTGRLVCLVAPSMKRATT